MFPPVISSDSFSWHILHRLYKIEVLSVEMGSGSVIPFLFVWVGSFQFSSAASPAVTNVLFFSLADDTLSAAWHGRKVSHELTLQTGEPELMVIYRENPFFEKTH